VVLTPEEGRVLGCLVEKQLTTPHQYPLTDNALIAACNQTTSRDPVVRYDLTTVRLAVRSLREKDLVRTVHRSGERSDKHQHELPTAMQLPPAEVALLAVLLLRGPQTAAELRARTERMHAFGSVEDVEDVLAALSARERPLVARLPRQPGRREDRYAELLVEAGASAPAASVDAATGGSAPGSGHRSPAPEPLPGPVDGRTAPDPPAQGHDVARLAVEVAALREAVAALREEVAALREEVADLRR
jgi:uncharacterized protein